MAGLLKRAGLSLTTRILVVNVIVLGLIAFSVLYLDSYRKQLLAERFQRARSEAEITVDALAGAAPAQRRTVLAMIGARQHLRLRLFDRHGALIADSFTLAPPSFTLADPARQPWSQKAARVLDASMDMLLGAPDVPDYHEPPSGAPTPAQNWPEVLAAARTGHAQVMERYAPDRTPVITAAAPLGTAGQTLLTLRNAPEVTQSVRDARQTLAIVVAVALLITVFLSLFLARTIVQPLRILVRAAVRVRLGRDRAVVVPRLPERGDEIGLLARALSDMTTALRQRMDAVESFAADVAHEIKNPLASLRSALESLDKVEDTDLRAQLHAIAAHDIQRMDRLITEISDASRIDAELSRTTLVPVNLLSLAQALVGSREARGANGSALVDVTQRGSGAPVVAGDAARLERVLVNLIDNAVSFSPPGGRIEVLVENASDGVTVEVCDEGPGIDPASRERVFERFHSLRPASEEFGQHSGLGLAIARTIVVAHDGSLTAQNPAPGRGGARLVLRLPPFHAGEHEA